jgi:hypothetical protein
MTIFSTKKNKKFSCFLSENLNIDGWMDYIQLFTHTHTHTPRAMSRG